MDARSRALQDGSRRMRRNALRFLSIFTLGCSTGCFLSALVPDTRTAAEHARDMGRKCTGISDDVIRPALEPSLVDGVEPDYVYMHSGPVDPEARLRGARIHLRPATTFTRETLQRGLECHQARVALGEVAREDDPYVLPGVWLDIDVDSTGDGFTIAVQTRELAKAKDVLQRARRFVATNK